MTMSKPSGPHIYALPETPPLFLPDDWEERVAQAGGVAVRVGLERHSAQKELLQKLGLSDSTPATLAGFYGLGLGFALMDAFFEGMQHPSSLAVNDFWADVQAAATAADEVTQHRLLQAAAQRLREARETLYSGTIYLLAVLLTEDVSAGSMTEAFLRHDLPCNIIASAETWQRWAKECPDIWPLLCERVLQERLEACAAPLLERPDALFACRVAAVEFAERSGCPEGFAPYRVACIWPKTFRLCADVSVASACPGFEPGVLPAPGRRCGAGNFVPPPSNGLRPTVIASKPSPVGLCLEKIRSRISIWPIIW
jgi:hypothetical protein